MSANAPDSHPADRRPPEILSRKPAADDRLAGLIPPALSGCYTLRTLSVTTTVAEANFPGLKLTDSLPRRTEPNSQLILWRLSALAWAARMFYLSTATFCGRYVSVASHEARRGAG
jgi:hypothetical protein